jgi:hypothetical protein
MWGRGRPIVNPTNDPIATPWIVAVHGKVSGAILKFDADPFTGPVGDAVRETSLHTLNVKPIAPPSLL